MVESDSNKDNFVKKDLITAGATLLSWDHITSL